MPASINQVILLGNVGADPEVKFTPSGVAVATFSLATQERFKDKSGEWQEKTEWHNLKAWQRTAEIVGEYVTKGKQLAIIGKHTTESWDDKTTGKKVYRSVIVVDRLVLLAGKDGAGSGKAKAESETVAEPTLLDDTDIPF